MKKLLLSIVTGLLLTANTQAQTALPVLNCESGDKKIESANCWGFGATAYSNLEFRIDGFCFN
jgi:hypothetical protein